jgi:hypothetical protein
MSAYRSVGYQRPCSGCSELASWACECCGEPRCDEHEPETRWCESCEEAFARSLVADGLYMVRRDNKGERQPWLDRPAFWSPGDDLRHLGLPLAWIVSSGVTLVCLVVGALAPALAFAAVALITGAGAGSQRHHTPQRALDKRIDEARDRYLETSSPKQLPPSKGQSCS